ncbi:MAG: hypothetical protein WAV10_00700 [Minisyncoccia bacterium]
MNKNFKKIKRNGGQAMIISVVFFLSISLIVISGLVSPSVREYKISNDLIRSRQSLFLAESGVEDAYYRLKNARSIGSSTLITVNGNTATTAITNTSASLKTITSLGDVFSRQRKSEMKISTGDGVVFKYGTQAGQGGISFKNNAYLKGSLYSNGNITGENGAYITGDAFVAGGNGLISNMRVGYGGTGDAHAHTITGSTVTGTIYCQHGSGNNKACDTSQADPVAQAFPISDESIASWKADATAGEVINNSVTISIPTTMGLKKIVGNLTVNKTLTITNTIYVTGNIIINEVSGSPKPPSIKLNSSYGSNSGIIIADGYIAINNNVVLQDSGTTGSYILFLSDSSCDAEVGNCNGKDAIDVNNNSNISIVNAQKGTVSFSNNAKVKEAVGNTIRLQNNVGIEYGSGITNVGFTSGPSGGWVLSSWQEVK